MAFDESTINFAVFEDDIEQIGVATATLPTLSAVMQTVSGAGISGNVEVGIAGYYDTMELGLSFRNFTGCNVSLSEPRLHNLQLRAAVQVEDPLDGVVRIQETKHVFVVFPKTDAGGSMAPASPSNGSGTYAVRYWATYIDGERVREIDPFNSICFINGVDYLADVRAALGK